MNRNMYIRSGEWVIISRGKFTVRLKDNIFKNLRFRVFLVVMLAGLIPGSAALLGIVKVYETRAVALRTAEIQNQCTIVTNQMSTNHYFSDTSSEVINSDLIQLTNIYNGRVMVIDEDLNVVKDTYGLDEGRMDVSENVIRCMKGESTNSYDKKNHYIEVTAPVTEIGSRHTIGVMVASVSTDSIEDSIHILYTQGGLIIGLCMILLAIVAVIFADRVVRPLRKITSAIENVSAGYSDDILHVDTYTETKNISESINKMMGRLKLLDDSREEFVSNVSHELKTPIALIQGYAEGLKEGVNDDPESREFYCDVIMDEASKMNHMVRNLLDLNQLEFGDEKIQFERFDLTELVKGVLQSMELFAEQKQAKVRFRQTEPLYVWGDEYKIEQVVRNYVSNAFNHLAGDMVVEVKIEVKDGIARTTVFNTGKPIPEEDISHIWEKFYKVDKAHTREYGGNGIGLSIVKAIMESLHQKYGVENYDNGVAFWFELEVK